MATVASNTAEIAPRDLKPSLYELDSVGSKRRHSRPFRSCSKALGA